MIHIPIDYIERFSRNISMWGKTATKKLYNSNVTIVGLGGVGGSACLTLARSGIGKLTIIDGDDFCRTNINRQIFAYESTIGKSKVNITKKYLMDINPLLKINGIKVWLNPQNISDIISKNTNFLLDCIDDVEAKIALIRFAIIHNIPIISSMGSGNHNSFENIKISDISKTRYCPLAKKIRKRLREYGIKNRVPVVFIDKEPEKSSFEGFNCSCITCTKRKKATTKFIGSTPFVPPVVGILMAKFVVQNILNNS